MMRRMRRRVEARHVGSRDHARGGRPRAHRRRTGGQAGTENCNKDALETLYPGIFTFGTDQPVYPPWYIGDNPANGEGFESALAYAVADKLDYARDDVRWVRVPFNAALAPGPKTFDANLSEFSITEQRKAAVDFSSPYFDVTQAVVTVKSSPAAGVHDARGTEVAAARRPGRHHQLHRGGRRWTAACRSRSTTPTATPRWR